MAELNVITTLLTQTLSPNNETVHTATAQLNSLSSSSPSFPLSLLSLTISGSGDQGLRIAAATYLKNLVRKNVYEEEREGEGQCGNFGVEFRDKLVDCLLRVEFPVLRVLVEAFRYIVEAEFVKKDLWPELVPGLRHAIQNSDMISGNTNDGWLTLNVLKALQGVIRPFQYFLNPKVAKEPVPPKLELIANEILAPLLATFHGFVVKALATTGKLDVEVEKFLLITCKCIYYAVRSYMPSSLSPLLPSFCSDLCGILNSLSLEGSISSEEGQQVRIKTGKRALLIFFALVTRHRKYSDKLLPDIMQCVLRIVSTNLSELDCLSERVVSLAFDVISHVLETGPGWRLVSPHFSSLLDSAILPALMMNTKDMLEWEEDANEFMSKNLPSDLEEVSGWREDLFTARKSAINLLGVISTSKGTMLLPNSKGAGTSLKRKKGEKRKGKDQHHSVGELLVLPFLSKFPMPCDANASDTGILNRYFGVLMGYGALQNFLQEQKPEYTAALIRSRILPLYTSYETLPYLVAAANWILGELASCLPEDIAAEVHSALLKALAMPDCDDKSFYIVRASAAGSIMNLLENEYLPPDWLPLLQVIVHGIGNEGEDILEDISILFQLLSSVVETGDKDVAIHVPSVIMQLVGAVAKYIPPSVELWPQAAIQGFAALAVMAKSWQDALPEEEDETGKWASDQAIIARAFSAILQNAWLVPRETMDDDEPSDPSCIDDASTLLWFIVHSISSTDLLLELKVAELLGVWAALIADWHGWEEVEDLPIFDCIKEVVRLESKFGVKNFFMTKLPSPPTPLVPQQSIIENLAAFICEAISQYSAAIWRACSCIHLLLHLPSYSIEMEDVKQSIVASFSQAAVSRFKELQSKPCSLWKPLLLAISSSYLCYPDMVEMILEKNETGGFVMWVSALNSVSSSSFTPNTSIESELKLAIITLAKVNEQLLTKGSTASGLLGDCLTSLLEASVRLKEMQLENAEEPVEEDDSDDEDEESDDGDVEDSDDDDDLHEETEEEFLKRYADAAAALENGTVIEEGDAEDYDEELELGTLEDLDPQQLVQSLLGRYHQILIKRQSLSPQLISSFLGTFPECSIYFQ